MFIRFAASPHVSLGRNSRRTLRSVPSRQPSEESSTRWCLPLLVGAAATSFTTIMVVSDVWTTVATTKTLCQEASESRDTNTTTTTKSSSNTYVKDTGDPQQPDDYHKLPPDDNDDDTDCLLCQTYRQGPCRRHWRNFEYCFKHQPTNDDNTAPAESTTCDKYIAPLQTCWEEHVHLYLLIAAGVHQEMIQQVLQSYEPHERRKWSTKIDWEGWENYLDDQAVPGTKSAKAMPRTDTTTKLPLWKRFDPKDGDPEVVSVSATVPISQQNGLLQLQLVFAVDQDNVLLGYAENDPSNKDTAAIITTCDVPICVLPDMTRTVRIFGLYRQANLGPGQEHAEAFLYESPPKAPPLPT